MPHVSFAFYYHAISSKQQLTLVIVGVDESGENILESNNKSVTALSKAIAVGVA